MLVQYCSDLHLEFPENKEFLKSNPLQPRGDILLLAGDITPFDEINNHADFFNYLADNFETSYWLPGNHEYYHSDIEERSKPFKENIRTNVFLVNKTVIFHSQIKFVFSTLWSEISNLNKKAIQKNVLDFKMIHFKNRQFNADHFNLLHNENKTFLEQELQKQRSGKVMVITHHAPSFLYYPPEFAGEISNEAFATELSGLIEQYSPDYWLFGHHHYNSGHFIIGKTRMITNQLGYVKDGEHELFSNDITISM